MQKNKIFYIYKIHFLCGFPSGRYYIGKRTYRGLEIKNDQYTGSGNFCKAYFKKYGEISGVTYIKEIIEINPSNKINLEREKILIGDLYKTDPLCMNMVQGGEGAIERKGHIPTKEEVEKRVVSFKKSKSRHKSHPPHSEETKRKLSKALRGNKNGLGHKHTEETKQKIIKALGKQVYQFDLDGNFVCKHDSVHAAAKAVNGFPINISNCCNGKYKSCYNYIWSFSNKHPEKYVDPAMKPVVKLQNDRVIAGYKSIAEAARQNNISASSISSVLSGRKKSASGYKWKYKEE